MGASVGKVDRDSASTKGLELGDRADQKAHTDDQVDRTPSAITERASTMTTKEPPIEAQGERERQGRMAVV